jgi:hypothetical protein
MGHIMRFLLALFVTVTLVGCSEPQVVDTTLPDDEPAVAINTVATEDFEPVPGKRGDEPIDEYPTVSNQNAWTAEEQNLITEAANINSQCRGGSGDDPMTDWACENRDSYYERLRKIGICFGREGQYGAEMDFHRCGADSF